MLWFKCNEKLKAKDERCDNLVEMTAVITVSTRNLYHTKILEVADDLDMTVHEILDKDIGTEQLQTQSHFQS